MTATRYETFICECRDMGHDLRISFDPDDEYEDQHMRYPELWAEAIFPIRYGFFTRLWIAAKYVFRGHQEYTYGSWLFRYEDKDRLLNLLNAYFDRVEELKGNVSGKDSGV